MTLIKPSLSEFEHIAREATVTILTDFHLLECDMALAKHLMSLLA